MCFCVLLLRCFGLERTLCLTGDPQDEHAILAGSLIGPMVVSISDGHQLVLYRLFTMLLCVALKVGSHMSTSSGAE